MGSAVTSVLCTHILTGMVGWNECLQERDFLKFCNGSSFVFYCYLRRCVAIVIDLLCRIGYMYVHM